MRASPTSSQSAEGMLHGPLGVGATILVRAEHVAIARDLLEEPPKARGVGAARAVRVHDEGELKTAARRLDQAGVPFLRSPAASFPADLFVRGENAERAKHALGLQTPEETA